MKKESVNKNYESRNELNELINENKWLTNVNNSIQKKRIHCKQRSFPKFQEYMGYTHSLTFLRFVAKLKVFFNFVKLEFQKTSSFPKFKIPKKISTCPNIFWNFGKLEVYLGILEHSKKTKDFFEFDPKTSKHPSFLNFIADSQKTHGFERFF